MRELLMMVFLMGKIALGETIRDFKTEERGASDMVAVVVLIVIIIAAAVIFREALMNAVQAVMDQLTEFVGG